MNPSSSAASGLRYVLFATAVAAIGGFLFGYDTAVINGALSYLKQHLGLTSAQEGTAAASAILGCIPGAAVAGFFSDRYGRRKLLFFCALLFAVSGVLSAIPTTLAQFVAARVLSGIGIGASSMICPVYIAEIAPQRWRGRLGALFQLGIVVGIFLTLFANRLIQSHGDDAWNAATGWRWMLGLEAVPAIVFIALLGFVPESPRWLALKGREAEAAAIIDRVSPGQGAAELAAIRAAAGEESGRFSELWSAAFRRPLVIALVLMICSQFCGINAIMYYSTKIFQSAGAATGSAFAASAWIGLINLLFTFVAIALVDRAGRRPLLLAGTAIQAVALAWVALEFQAGAHGTMLLLAVMTFIAAFAFAMGPLPWILSSEIFPNRIRGRAMSVATLTIWAACWLVAWAFPQLNDNPHIGPAKTFWIFAAVSAGSFLFVLARVPETKGRTLEEIEATWLARSSRVSR